MIADVQLPDYEMRIAILSTKAEELGRTLPGDVVEYIAQRDQTNIRELEGALNKVLAYAQIAAKPLNIETAIEALTDATRTVRRDSLTPADIAEAVAGALPDRAGRSARLIALAEVRRAAPDRDVPDPGTDRRRRWSMSAKYSAGGITPRSCTASRRSTARSKPTPP